jgi:pyruvate/2-oxoglutarate/acetoin dehydrogenase E1 component
MVGKAVEAAEILSKEGISVEVIDPRTVMPLDREAILESVKKTGRLVIVDEAQAFCGFSAEIAAMAAEHALEFLNAPIKRVCALHTPHPFNPVLESAMLPSLPQIVEAVRQVIRG